MIDIPELLDITFSNLDSQSLLACSVVSRSWYQLVLPHLWRYADFDNCDGMWPCRHTKYPSNYGATLILLLENYGRHLWHMHWPLGWMGTFVCMDRPSFLKTLRIPAFANSPRIFSQSQIQPFLDDVPVGTFGDQLFPMIRDNSHDADLIAIRMIWHLILNSPSLQRIEFESTWQQQVTPSFQYQGAGPNFSTVMISPGGQFFQKIFQKLPKLRHIKYLCSMNASCLLMVLTNVRGGLYVQGATTMTEGPMSLELQSLDLQQFLSHELRPEKALRSLTNYNIRYFDVKNMNLLEIDSLMTIMPALETLYVYKAPTRDHGSISSYLASETWSTTLRHSALKTMRLGPWVTGLLTSHVLWDKLEKFEAPRQQLLWGLALLLERMPNVQDVEIVCSSDEYVPDATMIQQLQLREATQSPLSVRSLIVHTRLNRSNSAMLALLPRLGLLTKLELYIKRAPVLKVIAQSCPLLEHFTVHCEYFYRDVGQRELHMILIACSKLKTVRAKRMGIRAIDLIQKPVTCLGLQELEVMIKGIPRLTKEQTRALGDFQFSPVEGRQKEYKSAFRRHRQSVEMERQVMEQLARLTELRVLILSRKHILTFRPNSPYCSSPALTLESGFGLLGSLQALHTFEFEKVDHQMGLQELLWINAHWPRIVTIRGVVQTHFGPLHSPISLPRGRGRGRGGSGGRGGRGGRGLGCTRGRG